MKESWNDFLNIVKTRPYYSKLNEYVKEEYQTKTIFPPRDKIYRAFQLCPLSNLKVVILGQDPYHSGFADGLAFSASGKALSKGKENSMPPSLLNILKELKDDVGVERYSKINRETTATELGKGKDLSGWAEQGVLLLNTILTVEQGKAKSHHGKGWEKFTEDAIRFIDSISIKYNWRLVYILWGNDAGENESMIKNKSSLILKSGHPSPLAVSTQKENSFIGSKPFSKTNDHLKKVGLPVINWAL